MMMPARLARTFTAAATLAFLALLACAQKPPEHGTVINDPQPAPPLHLADPAGRAFDLAAQRGQPAFVYFGYTHCPDACPTTLTDWARAKALLGASGSRVRLLFVSVDPDRDTPEIAARYARQFDPAFVGLVVPAAQLEGIKTAWGFAVEHEEMPGMKADEYGVSHPAGVFFVDSDGKMKFVFAPGSKPEEIASDLKRLM
jgi:protein SCO1/2